MATHTPDRALHPNRDRASARTGPGGGHASPREDPTPPLDEAVRTARHPTGV